MLCNRNMPQVLQTLLRRRRIAAVVLVAAIAAVGARVAAPAPSHSGGFSAALSCGVERWSVKTLKDRPLLLPARATTVANLTRLPAPGYLPARRRLASERRVYSVVASVTLKPEADLDYHLVLRSGGRTMIAEAPSSLCTSGATAARRKQMLAARIAVRECARARIVGVGFFDYRHGQTGVAPNGIELHPVLGFACLSGAKPPPPPPPPPSGGRCAASYPTVCIPPPPPDLDCGDISYRDFRVRWDVADADPHRFDGNRDGFGCES
jgi:hypothetical protein